jgi:hypothetical protein
MVWIRGLFAAAVLALLVPPPPAFAQELSIQLSRKPPRPTLTHRTPDPDQAEQAAERARREHVAGERPEQIAERWREIDRDRERNVDIVRATQLQALQRALRR